MSVENIDLDLRAEIRDIVAEILELDADQITWNSHFWDELEADSMQGIEILAALERRYRITIEQSSLTQMHDVESTCGVVLAALKDARSDAP
jgi:acyl carrier protein